MGIVDSYNAIALSLLRHQAVTPDEQSNRWQPSVTKNVRRGCNEKKEDSTQERLMVRSMHFSPNSLKAFDSITGGFFPFFSCVWFGFFLMIKN